MTDTRRTHSFDQFSGFLIQLAASLALYRKELLAKDFSEEESFTLTRDYQRYVCTPQKKHDEDKL